jgi:hypothetical protein
MLQAIQNDHRKPLPVTLERSRGGAHDKNLFTPVHERDGIFLFFSNPRRESSQANGATVFMIGRRKPLP